MLQKKQLSIKKIPLIAYNTIRYMQNMTMWSLAITPPVKWLEIWCESNMINGHVLWNRPLFEPTWRFSYASKIWETKLNYVENWIKTVYLTCMYRQYVVYNISNIWRIGIKSDNHYYKETNKTDKMKYCIVYSNHKYVTQW